MTEKQGVIMDNEKLFENGCFPLYWLEDEEEFKAPLPVQRKDLTTLLAELEDIKNRINDISAKEWYLAKSMKLHKEGLAKN